MILGEDFYRRDTVVVARDLLGKVLVHETPHGETSGIIIETEAYLMNDEACHASRGKTKRNATMFGAPGRAYVYLIYGIHYCFNAVTGEEGVGEAVLVRSLRPLTGVELMQRRRRKDCPLQKLTSGPGNLCKAMGITDKQNGLSLEKYPLCVFSNHNGVSPEEIRVTTRVGISKAVESELRFYLNTYHTFVSGR